MFNLAVFVVLSTSVPNVLSLRGLHLATQGLLQIHPSFSSNGIFLYPGHHPDHNSADLEHLTPSLSNELYYAQEGHRPAVHGAKHGSMKATFTRPTIVLDHSSHLSAIQCGSDSNISLCFTPEGFKQVQKTWTVPELNLVTFHVGCGDETSGKRSYFLATDPQFNARSGCVRVHAVPIDQEDALDSGEIAWGTYQDPEKSKTTPVKGHVRVATPAASHDPQLRRTNRRETPSKPAFSTQRYAPLKLRQDNLTDNATLPWDDGKPTVTVDGSPVDLTENVTALEAFYGNNDTDPATIHDPAPASEDPDLITMNGTVGTEAQEGLNLTRRRSLGHPHRLGERDVAEFFKGVANAVTEFVEDVKNFVTKAVNVIIGAAETIVQFAIIAAKVIAVPFGVPFDESYHNDFNFTYVVSGSASASNRPPPLFGYTDGFNLAGTGTAFSVQCAKCGIHADMSVEGRLAFSIQNGLTDGYVALVNNNAFTIDAVFGIILEVQYDQPIKLLDQKIAQMPLSPLTIPGIVTLGPQLAVDAALDLVLNGQASLLIGGSLSIGAGTAQLGIVSNRSNTFNGFSTSFTPVAQFNGSLTASMELGLPVTLEVGLDVLSGKFKKTVGLVEKPSIYAAAVASPNLLTCGRGIDLRLGVKNRIYVQAIGLWDYDIRTDILYEQSLACVTAGGFDAAEVLPELLVFNDVPLVVGDDIANIKPNISDVAANLSSATNGNVGFRIIMDEDKSSILVSGSDGYIYLIGTDQQYDASAPWGSVDLTTNAVGLDVFGRVMGWMWDEYKRTTAGIRVFDPAKVPWNYQAAALTVANSGTGSYNNYIIAGRYYKSGPQIAPFYPTFCKTPQGLRLYGTYWIVDQSGVVHGADAFWSQSVQVGLTGTFNITNVASNCRTVRLISVAASS